MTWKRCYKPASLLAAVCVLSFCGESARAAIMLPPDADARLSNDSNRGPTSNNGTSGVWEIRDLDDGAAVQRIRIGYVRYDISGVNPALFNTATISGNFESSSKNGPTGGAEINVYGLNDSLGADNWGETSVNYSNAEGVDNSAALGTYAFDLAEVTLLGSIFTDGIDVQPLAFSSNTTDLPLGAFLAADTDGLVTFLFQDANATGSEFNPDSKEGSTSNGHGPTTLNFTPEPSSFALIGLVLAGLGVVGRRKQS